MAKTFHYKAVSNAGDIFEESMSAESKDTVIAHIKKKGWFPLEINEKETSENSMSLFYRPVKTKELAFLCQQLSTMISGGVSLLDSMKVLIETTENKKLKEALRLVYAKVSDGAKLSTALAERKDIFPKLMVEMIAVAETGGFLDKVLSKLAEHFEKKYEVDSKVKTAMTYPIIVLVVSLFVSLFMLIFILPSIGDMYQNFNVEINPYTAFLLALSTALRTHYLLAAIGFTVFLSGIAYAANWLYQPEQAQLISNIVRKIPVLGNFQLKVSLARFIRVFGTLIKGGVPALDALNVTKNVVEDSKIQDALSSAEQKIKQGQSLAKAFAETEVFPTLFVQMLAIGETAGSLDNVLERLAEFYEKEIDETTKRLSSLLEPVLILIMVFIVGSIAISFFLPMFQAASSIATSVK